MPKYGVVYSPGSAFICVRENSSNYRDEDIVEDFPTFKKAKEDLLRRIESDIRTLEDYYKSVEYSKKSDVDDWRSERKSSHLATRAGNE